MAVEYHRPEQFLNMILVTSKLFPPIYSGASGHEGIGCAGLGLGVVSAGVLARTLDPLRGYRRRVACLKRHGLHRESPYGLDFRIQSKIP